MEKMKMKHQLVRVDEVHRKHLQPLKKPLQISTGKENAA